ncbi:radical SAM protein [Thermosulfurimonas marina]|uniref:Radical SAM protein n=1 Tax=Thermosulfurimonas marina TaxID=2047767 RepID=A0A6H1WTR4_9BACT|nr:radical SAM protein [Thermosulfurimonas marina]QJA06539.1 radical SAM protein [Thermosulfurimonas marina]
MELAKYLGRRRPVLLHLTVTGRCQARCEGCINALSFGRREDFWKDWECEPERDTQALAELIDKAKGRPAVVAFYGGEPLLAAEKMEAVRSRLRALFSSRDLRFMLYTNGELISRALAAHPNLFQDLWLVSVSIDGSERQHNFFRRGTDLARIRENLRALRRASPARVLMWSTLREGARLADCLAEFLRLEKEGLADYFFWHLIELDEPIRDFPQFFQIYQQDLVGLFEHYLERLARGQILPVLPLNELLFFLLKGLRRGHTGCGVERAENFDLQGGKVLPCADLGEDFVLAQVDEKGRICWQSSPGALSLLVNYREELGCPECSADFYCGGRCPVLFKNSPERARQYCLLTRALVSLAREGLPEVHRILSRRGLSPEDLYFPYGYLALFTDVVP